MNTRLLAALVAGRPRKVCGRLLMPFSIGHRCALHAAGSPFVTGVGSVEPGDIVHALRVCASPTPLSVAFEPTLRDRIAVEIYTRMPSKFAAALCEFREYIEDNTSGPELWGRDKKGESDNIDGALHTIAALVRCGVPIESALAMSEGLAVWMHVAIARQEGADLSVVSEAEKQLMQKLERLNSNG